MGYTRTSNQVGSTTSTNFVVGATGDFENSMNLTGRTYYWIAWV